MSQPTEITEAEKHYQFAVSNLEGAYRVGEPADALVCANIALTHAVLSLTKLLEAVITPTGPRLCGRAISVETLEGE